MKLYNRVLGGVLLVAGTSIGAGMLALPVSTSFGGFIPSLFIFLLAFACMLASALFLLDVNLEIRGEPNLISMAEKTLGQVGKFTSWILYLLLLYSLLAAYLSACIPLFILSFEKLFSVRLSASVASYGLPILFGSFVYLGTRGVDYLNRLLMVGLGATFFLLAGALPPYVEAERLLYVDLPKSLLGIPVVITSFGYHIIIPTLTTYLEHRRSLLRKTLLLGSAIPLVIYLLWQLLVLGSIPSPLLATAFHEGEAATEAMATFLGAGWIGLVGRFFSFFAVTTSFLGVSLSLSDFLTDGLKIKKSWEGRLLAIGLTFAPPLLFVFSCREGFYLALEYAGALVALLLGVIPCLMVLKIKNHPWYQTKKGKMLVYFVTFLFCFVVILDIVVRKTLF